MIIGIDISKHKFDVFFFGKKTHFEYKNTPAGIKAFLSSLKKEKSSVEMITMEITGEATC